MSKGPERHSSPGPLEIVIEPPTGTPAVSLSEIWAYRELLAQLVWRDIAVRYKQTALGVSWALLNPVLTAAVFSIIFGLWARMPSNDIPYPVFFLAGLIPWAFFASALSGVADSMVKQRALLTKVYFPRIIAPLAATAIALADYLLAIFVLLTTVFIFGFIPGPEALLVLPVATLWLWGTALGLGLWFAAFNVRYRDTGQIVPFTIRIGMFASPIIYPVSMIPDEWHWLYGLNPVVGAIEWIRWSLFGLGDHPNPVFFASALLFLPVFAGGLRVFRGMEDTYADTV